MNILMVHPHDLFSPQEPWTIRIKKIAQGLNCRGHKIRLCYFPNIFGDKKRINCSRSIELIALDRFPSPKIFIKNIVKIVQLARWADIIHLQKCHPYASVPALIAAYVHGKPLHYDWDDWEEKIWHESSKKNLNVAIIGLFFKILERWLPFLATSVSCASQNLKDLALSFRGRGPIFYTPVGVDLDRFRPDVDSSGVRGRYEIEGNLVLYIGQLHGAQYVDILLQAAREVLSQNNNITFMVVGDGFKRKQLERFAGKLGIKDRVIFTGAVDYRQIPAYICAADICIASFADNSVTNAKSPLKVVEYLACGRPVIASRVAEVEKMIAGAGVLVKAGDYQDLAKNILSLAVDKRRRQQLGIKGRERAQKDYSWQETIDTLLKAYDRIDK